MDKLSLFLALGGSTLVTLIVTALWNMQRNGINKIRKSDREEHVKEIRDLFKEEIQPISQQLQNIEESLEKNNEGTTTLLRETMCRTIKYYMRQGYVSDRELSNWHSIYKLYKDLGGNHFKEYVDGWKQELESLPVITEEEEIIRQIQNNKSDKGE